MNDDDEEESEEVEALSDVTARHLEQIVFVELLEHAALQLNELKFWEIVDLKYSSSRVPPNVITLAPRETDNTSPAEHTTVESG